MSYPLTLHIIGGQGGNAFSFDGRNNAATLQKISVSVGGWQVRGVEVWLTDGRRQKFGTVDFSAQQFEFQSGEFMSQLSLWGNGAGTRLGAIKFRTSRNREFFAKMTDWGLKTEYKIDVGSGICLGVQGRAGADIDSMGFLFINAVKSSVIQNMKYPTMHQVLPNVQMEEIKEMEYTNNTSVMQSYTFESSKKITKTSSWSTTNKIEFTFSLTVSAGIPEVVEIKEMEYTNNTSVMQSYTFESSKKITKTSSWSTTNKIEFTFSLTVSAGIPEVVEIKEMEYTNNTSVMQSYTFESSKKITKTSSWSTTNKIEFTFSLTVSAGIPEVVEIKEMEYTNNTSVMQSYTFESSKKITKTSSWSTTNKIEFTFSLTVSAGIPEVVEVETGFSFTLSSETTHALEESEERMETLTFPVSVPPHKTVTVVAKIGRANIDLPYTALLRITCMNGALFDVPLSGVYKGLTYTKMTARATEK
ncbi:unnamed protein product [Lampetra fluviatilis]